jgi:Rps23 Pro-64 3,4-dihydroxylase Tpa1-like proline 4-hydroxylase
MTPKQILDSFSDTLMRDERILSARERALLTNLLQHARAASSEDQKTQAAVWSVISSAVGETVAQRAFAVLGTSIVERILEGSGPLPDTSIRSGDIGTDLFSMKPPALTQKSELPTNPQHPGRSVPTPLTPKDPQHPGTATPTKVPVPVVPPDPQHPGHAATRTIVSTSATAVAEKPAVLPANCVVLDEFLAPEELSELTRFAIEHETDFHASEVVSPSSENGVVNYEHRRSRVLTDLPRHERVMFERIKTVLPQVLQKLGMPEFQVASVEAQITASNDGDYFHFHCDNGSDPVASRHLTFVYFFHREPKQFGGGELRLHDARLEEGAYVSEGSYQTIVPQQNQIVFFPCELLHEITPVNCESRQFADSRFTLNGWLRR